MKTESTAKYIVRLALTLLLITTVVAAALAGVNYITAPRIAEMKAEKTQKAVEEVLPGGGEAVQFSDDSGMISAVYVGENGYALKVTPAGFGDTITMMVGMDKNCSVLGISVISHGETAGLGAVAAAKTTAGENFRGQFVGIGGAISVTKDGGQIDAITGATVTSRAVCAGVEAALTYVGSLDG